MFFDEAKAQECVNANNDGNSNTNNCDDGDDGQLITDLVSGHVTFQDSNKNTISIPNDGWIRITP
jgi:hypothetical protein